MAYTGKGNDSDVYTTVGTERAWIPSANLPAGCVSANVPDGVTRTIPTEHDVVVYRRFILHGTGHLILEGDATLVVL